MFWASSGQWTLFILANLVVIPIIVGHAFGFDSAQIGWLLQRTLIITGLLTGLQTLLSHRLPMIEGPSGLWLSVFLAIALSAGPNPAHLQAAWDELRLGLIISGAVSALFAIFGLVGKIQRLFTPLVTGVYLILLSVQLSNVFLAGMLSPPGVFHGPILLAEMVLMALVIVISVRGPVRLRPFGVLVALLVGWGIFLGMGWAPGPVPSPKWVNWPFVGPMVLRWNTGIVLTCVITGFINITNTIASLNAISESFRQLGVPTASQSGLYDRTSLGTGLGNILAGLSAVVGVITFSISAGFVQMTRDPARRPFMAASALMVVLGFLPPLTSVLANIPPAVGDAVLLVTYVQMLGMGLASFSKSRLTPQSIYRAGLPLLIGIGLTAMPPATFAAIPGTVRILAQNGLVVGVILAVVLELVPWPQGEPASG